MSLQTKSKSFIRADPIIRFTSLFLRNGFLFFFLKDKTKCLPSDNSFIFPDISYALPHVQFSKPVTTK